MRFFNVESFTDCKRMTTEKPKELRVKETVELLKKFPTLGIPLDSPEVMELRQHLNAYINDGTVWSGTISFRSYGRMADVTLPRRADKPIEVLLRACRSG
jgi:hypothetical protein